MKLLPAALLAAAAIASLPAHAQQPVSIGKGIYMMTDRNLTIFGSSDGIVAKLMTKANAFCQKSQGVEAELVDSGGSEAIPGTINSSGMLRRPAQGATGTIHFRCDSAPGAAPAAEASPALPDSYYERIDWLRERVLSGDIPAGKGVISQTISPAFAELSPEEVEMLEGRSTWWVGESGTWFIHLINATNADLEAIQFSVNFGSCKAPTSPVERTSIQLVRTIRAGEQAVISFPKPISTENIEPLMCGTVSAAWGPRGSS